MLDQMGWPERVGRGKGIWVRIGEQRLFLIEHGAVLRSYPCSTARAGAGELKDSGCTPRGWHVIAEKAGWPTAVCEGSFVQTDDGVLHMLLRAELRGFHWWLWQTDSEDDGTTWCPAVETRYTDCNAKFHLGRLPDGRFYNVGNPLPGNRWPLIMSLSEDGVNFGRHLILGEGHWPMAAGAHKPGEYGYPHTVVHEGHVYVLVSRQKQAIEVLRVAVEYL